MVTALISYAPPRLRLLTYLPEESQKLSLCLDRDQLRFWMRELAIDFADGQTHAVAAAAVEVLEDPAERAEAAKALEADDSAALYTALHDRQRGARFASKLMSCLELVPEPLAEGEAEEWEWAGTATTREESIAEPRPQRERPRVLQLRTAAAAANAEEERSAARAKAKAEAISDAEPLLLREAVTLVDGAELVVTLRGVATHSPTSTLSIVAYDVLTGVLGRATVAVPTALVNAGKEGLRSVCRRLRVIESAQPRRAKRLALSAPIQSPAMALWIGPADPLTLLHRNGRRSSRGVFHFVTISELVGGVTPAAVDVAVSETDVSAAALTVASARQPAWRIAAWPCGATGGAESLARTGGGALSGKLPATLVVTGDALTALVADASAEAAPFARAVATIAARRVHLLVLPAAPPTVRRHTVYKMRRDAARRQNAATAMRGEKRKKKQKEKQATTYTRKVETRVVIRHSLRLLRTGAWPFAAARAATAPCAPRSPSPYLYPPALYLSLFPLPPSPARSWLCYKALCIHSRRRGPCAAALAGGGREAWLHLGCLDLDTACRGHGNRSAEWSPRACAPLQYPDSLDAPPFALHPPLHSARQRTHTTRPPPPLGFPLHARAGECRGRRDERACAVHGALRLERSLRGGRRARYCERGDFSPRDRVAGARW